MQIFQNTIELNNHKDLIEELSDRTEILISVVSGMKYANDTKNSNQPESFKIAYKEFSRAIEIAESNNNKGQYNGVLSVLYTQRGYAQEQTGGYSETRACRLQ